MAAGCVLNRRDLQTECSQTGPWRIRIFRCPQGSNLASVALKSEVVSCCFGRPRSNSRTPTPAATVTPPGKRREVVADGAHAVREVWLVDILKAGRPRSSHAQGGSVTNRSSDAKLSLSLRHMGGRQNAKDSSSSQPAAIFAAAGLYFIGCGIPASASASAWFETSIAPRSGRDRSCVITIRNANRADITVVDT